MRVLDEAAIKASGAVRFRSEYDYAVFEYWRSAKLMRYLERAGIRAFGPRKNAAILEGSKAFAKEMMKKLSIPTGEFEIFTSADKAMDYVAKKGIPIVVKVDGLAGGKGVVVAHSLPKAMEAIHLDMVKKVFGKGVSFSAKALSNRSR